MSIKTPTLSQFQENMKPFMAPEEAALLETQLKNINNDKYLSGLRISVIEPNTLTEILNDKATLDKFLKTSKDYTFSFPQEEDPHSAFISLLSASFQSDYPYKFRRQKHSNKSAGLVAYTLDGKCIGRGKDTNELFKGAYCKVEEKVKSAIDSFFKNYKYWISMQESIRTLRYIR